MSKTKPSVKIVNVVATASSDRGFDLDTICKAFPTAEYRPKVFPGLCLRLKKPKTATLIFANGKMVCTGARSASQAKMAIGAVVSALKGKGIPILATPTVHIQNIVASVGLGGEIDLERVVYDLKHTIYEPEQFPGAIYRMDNPRVVFLIFSNGNLVCVGAKMAKDVSRAVDKLKSKIEGKGAISYGDMPHKYRKLEKAR